MSIRIHITGAAGSGVSTLGADLAERIGGVHLDSDDFYWEPTDPPFQRKREPAERVSLIREAVAGLETWVLSGSLMLWGDPLVPLFDLVVFLHVPTEVRLARLKERETRRFGAAALAPGGVMHKTHRGFMAWAAGYETGALGGRSLERHRQWLSRLPCPVLRIEGTYGRDELSSQVMAHAQLATAVS
jgi:adenylate kinase family enzyme